MIITKEMVRVTKGPRDNSFRPSVDTLFRLAAVHFGSAVIGVILSGMMAYKASTPLDAAAVLQ